MRALERPPLRPVIRGIAAGGDDALIAALGQALYDCETTELNVGILELVGALEPARVTGRLVEHVVSALEMDDDAVNWLADKGYDAAMGARPMARVVQQEIKQALAEELLFGKLAKGGHVNVSLGEQGLEFNFGNSR